MCNFCVNFISREQKIQLVYAEVIQFEFNLRKIEKMIDANNAEIQYYQREQTKLDQEICTGVKEIENLKETLLMEQTNRTNKIEYDQIAESILTLAPRNELERYIIFNDFIIIC